MKKFVRFFIENPLALTLLSVVMLLLGMMVGQCARKVMAKTEEKDPIIANKITVNGVTYKGDVYTDGVIYAIYKENTLTFAGEGAVTGSHNWVSVKNKLIKKIVFADGITSISDLGFDGDYVNLEEVVFEGNVNYIDDGSFEDNHNLKRVIMKGVVRDYGYRIFEDCGALEEAEGVPNDMLKGTPLYEEPEISIIAPPSDSKKDPQTSAPETDRSAPNVDPFQAL